MGCSPGGREESDTTELLKLTYLLMSQSFPGEGDLSLTPGLGRLPGEGNSNPLPYSCLENSMEKRAWWATVHGVAKSQT